MTPAPTSPSGPPNDPQVERLYAAEETVIVEIGRRFRRWADVAAFFDAVMSDDRFHESFNEAPLEIEVQRRSRSARASVAVPGDRVIWIRDGAWNAITILHELAHLAQPTDEPHGPEFAAAELELVRLFCGFEAFIALRSAFDAHDVGH